MAEEILSTNTRAEGWQLQCLDWAKAGQTFRISGVRQSHLTFLDAFCDAHRYFFKLIGMDTAEMAPIRDR